MGPRIQSPSLVDEYVCESMSGENCMRASSKYIKKIAEQYKDDVEIPFTYRNNVSLALQRIQTDEPTASQAKELVNYITRAIVDSCPKFEGSCRWCPWCLNIVPASVIRCLLCNAQLVSVGRFMDQSSLGKPRSLDSEVVIDVEESTVADIDVAIELTLRIQRTKRKMHKVNKTYLMPMLKRSLMLTPQRTQKRSCTGTARRWISQRSI